MAEQVIDQELLESFLSEASDALVEWEQACLSLNAQSAKTQLPAIFRVAHNIKGSSRAIGLMSLGDFIHKVEDFIVVLIDQPEKVDARTTQLLLQVHTSLSGWFNSLKSDPHANPVVSTLLNSLTLSKEVMPIASSTENDTKSADGDNRSTEKDATYSEHSLSLETPVKIKPTLNQERKSESVRIRAQRLDQLIQMIGELAIHQDIVMHQAAAIKCGNPELQKAMNAVSKMAKEIQSQAIGLRMQEVRPLFQRLERTAKEIAFQLEKKVEIHLAGSDLELDKSVIEIITEPLVHMARNAIDHGVESPAERIIDGKPEVANIFIEALAGTDDLKLIIKDDGRGINHEKVYSKALAQGLIRPEQNLSQEEIINLIFRPGFSTAEKVTSVSGRGVGMEVVKNAIDSVGGRIEIQSVLGQGTTFVITLPTTMNIVDTVLIRIGEERFLIPLTQVSEILDLKSNQINEASGKSDNLLRVRDDLLPLEEMSDYIRFREHRRNKQESDKIPVVIAGRDRLRVAFKVDQILGQQRVIVKDISGINHYPRFINGVTVLGDGKPGMIISLVDLLQAVGERVKTKTVVEAS